MSTSNDFFKVISNIQTKRSLDFVLSRDNFVPYMISRYLSFYDPVFIKLINETSNRFNGSLEEDNFNTMYNYFISFFPKVPNKFIKYVKKETTKVIQEDTDITEEMIERMSRNLEISKREVRENIVQLTKLTNK